jgi:hypothetical protein
MIGATVHTGRNKEGASAMKMLSFEAFLGEFGDVKKHMLDMSIYRDSFQCACGRSHWFDEQIDIVGGTFFMKLMVVCPEDHSYLTSIKIKTFMLLKFTGFKSLAGTRMNGEIELTTLRTARHMLASL